MKIPDRLAEDAFWELENNPNLEVLKDCEQIASNNEQSRELYIKVRAMHFMLIEKKNSIEEARRLVKTEELWDDIKRDNNKQSSPNYNYQVKLLNRIFLVSPPRSKRAKHSIQFLISKL